MRLKSESDLLLELTVEVISWLIEIDSLVEKLYHVTGTSLGGSDMVRRKTLDKIRHKVDEVEKHLKERSGPYTGRW